MYIYFFKTFYLETFQAHRKYRSQIDTVALHLVWKDVSILPVFLQVFLLLDKTEGIAL